MITSKLATKSQTTIPQAVRSALHLKAGDEIAYMITGDKVVMTKAELILVDHCFATFSEWGSEADRKAYANL
ncbi:transcriptional regulator [Bradyrhizobium sp. CCBAU 45389]|nr:transcriptional regulator [Bradyrhizobium sp. CCBAU 45389]